MPEEGEYLLTGSGFTADTIPVISLQKAGVFADLHPIKQTLSLQFDTTQRYCTGWRDIATETTYACPDTNTVEPKYETCAACQKRTGFNPAFYHAPSVSAQQEARNNEPHLLYLAHFGPGVIKVGISYAKRGSARLLEQGARTALILDTFPTAHAARQHEARIAAMPHMRETVQIAKKALLLIRSYDKTAAEDELRKTREMIEASVGTTFQRNNPRHLDAHYFPDGTPNLTDAHDTSPLHAISGRCVGMLGSFLFCETNGRLVYLSLKKHFGYKLTFSREEISLPLPAQQTSFF